MQQCYHSRRRQLEKSRRGDHPPRPFFFFFGYPRIFSKDPALPKQRVGRPEGQNRNSTVICSSVIIHAAGNWRNREGATTRPDHSSFFSVIPAFSPKTRPFQSKGLAARKGKTVIQR